MCCSLFHLKKHCRGKRGKVGFRGPTGATGPTGVTGATGATGAVREARSSWIFMSASIEVLRPDPFAIQTSSFQTQTFPFDPSTSNPSPPNFAQTFLVPEDGTISELSLRIQARAVTDLTSVQFVGAVYQSPTTFGSAVLTPGWTITPLQVTTPSTSIPNFTSMTCSAQSSPDSTTSVSAGSLLCVVVTPSGYNQFDIQPATVNATFRYVPAS